MTTIEEQRTMIAIQQLNAKVPEVTLRDLFAMSVLNGLISGRYVTDVNKKDIAKLAYKQADVMLEARKK